MSVSIPSETAATKDAFAFKIDSLQGMIEEYYVSCIVVFERYQVSSAEPEYVSSVEVLFVVSACT